MSIPGILTTIVVLFASLGLGSSQSTQLDQNRSKAPLSVDITVPQDAVPIGSDIKIGVSITNMSSHLVSFLRTPGGDHGELLMEIEVTDEQGNPVPGTKYGESLKEHGIDSLEGSRITERLKPGESFKDYVVLNRLYDLSHPGKYTVYAKQRIPDHLGGGVVKSSPVTLTLIDNSQ